jgi:hypothetical protein
LRPTIDAMRLSWSNSAIGLAGDEAAVAQDGHAVADLEHLLEVVGRRT